MWEFGVGQNGGNERIVWNDVGRMEWIWSGPGGML